MWIDGCNGNASRVELKTAQFRVDETNEVDVEVGGKLRKRVAQRQVNRGKDDFKGWSKECHRKSIAPGLGGEVIGLAVKGAADRVFVDGCCDDPLDFGLKRSASGRVKNRE